MNQITSSATAPIVAVFESAQSIRIVMIDNEPWFSVADVCDILGYANSRKTVSDHCRAGGVTKRDTPTASGIQPLTYINEGNLYRLVIKSRMPAAEKFESWVCDEVLPTIRKTGSYVVQAEPEYEPEEECRVISESESEKMRKMVQGIARCMPTLSSTKVSQTIYGRIKSPLRVGRIDEFPVSHYDRAMQYLDRMLAVARQHNRKQEALDMALLSKITEGSEVAA